MKVVVLTGAGISAESGISTFRDSNGLWNNHSIEDVASPAGFEKNPALVHEFYNLRRRDVLLAEPNLAHLALAKLQQELFKIGMKVHIITQNVDDLHERAGADVIHVHGELLKARCAFCDIVTVVTGDLSIDTVCARCGVIGQVRPHIVWFGEELQNADRLLEALAEFTEGDLFVAIGTSGNVSPAADWVSYAASKGAFTLEINLDNTTTSSRFREAIRGPATITVPAWVESTLAPLSQWRSEIDC